MYFLVLVSFLCLLMALSVRHFQNDKLYWFCGWFIVFGLGIILNRFGEWSPEKGLSLTALFFSVIGFLGPEIWGALKNYTKNSKYTIPIVLGGSIFLCLVLFSDLLVELIGPVLLISLIVFGLRLLYLKTFSKKKT